MQFQIHVGKSRDLGPIQLFSAFEAVGSANNVVDATSAITADCPSGRCRVGVYPDTIQGASRIVYIDAMEESTAGPVNVNIRGLGKVATIQVEILPAEAPQFPSAIVIDTAMISPEYTTPVSR